MQEQAVMQYAGGIPVYCAFDEILDIERVQPNPQNPNQHSEEQIALLSKMIRVQGWRAPVTISTRSGLVVRGHGRLMAAQQAGCTQVPVDYQSYVDEASELADLVADNRIAELAQMDAQMLADIFHNLSDIDLELTGFTQDALRDILVNPEQIDVEAADKKIPKAQGKPFSQLGDIWQLGRHRLICGDSTKPLTYKKLMQDERAQMILTDPPYNVDYEGSAGKIQNDCMSKEQFRQFLLAMYQCAAAVACEGAAIYVFYSDKETFAFRQGLEEAGFQFKQCLIWVKNTFVLGRQDYQWRHEPILYGWKAGGAHYFTEARNLSTVLDDTERPDFDAMEREELVEYVEAFYDMWNEARTSTLYCDKPARNAEHPTMKPTALIAKLIENSSKRDWIVLDPFGGSGPTLVACEAEGRIARVIEIDPKFCDVIVKRYLQLTGKQDVFCLRHGMKIPVQETKLWKAGDSLG